MKNFNETVDDIVHGKAHCPLDLSVIPNHMGINLCAVDSISWQEQEDGQLVNLTIYFTPEKQNELA